MSRRCSPTVPLACSRVTIARRRSGRSGCGAAPPDSSSCSSMRSSNSSATRSHGCTGCCCKGCCVVCMGCCRRSGSFAGACPHAAQGQLWSRSASGCSRVVQLVQKRGCWRHAASGLASSRATQQLTCSSDDSCALSSIASWLLMAREACTACTMQRYCMGCQSDGKMAPKVVLVAIVAPCPAAALPPHQCCRHVVDLLRGVHGFVLRRVAKQQAHGHRHGQRASVRAQAAASQLRAPKRQKGKKKEQSWSVTWQPARVVLGRAPRLLTGERVQGNG